MIDSLEYPKKGAFLSKLYRLFVFDDTEIIIAQLQLFESKKSSSESQFTPL
jgi:hypothetical protein